MSFSADLWHSLDLVQKHSHERRKGLEELIQLLRERAMYEDFYSQGLVRIASHPYSVTSQGSLSRVVSAMREECSLRASISNKLSLEITAELVEPLGALLKAQNEEEKRVAKKVKNALKEVEGLRKALEKAQKEYKDHFQQSEQFVVRVEGAKSYSEKKKFVTLQTNELNKAMQFALKSYKDAITAYNVCVPRYQESLTEALSAYQTQEEVRLGRMGDALKKLWEHERRDGMVIEEEGRKREDAYGGFSVEEDVQLFISENKSSRSTAHCPQNFEPYQGDHWAFIDLGDSAPTLCWDSNDYRFSTYISAPVLSDDELEAVRGRVEDIMSKAWNGGKYRKEVTEFRDIVKDARGRKMWVSYMNAKRAEGKFKMSGEGFNAVAELMNILLDECENFNDIGTGKSCIILSQTFHHFRSSEKEFLQAKIVGHSLWRGEAIWDAIIKDGIDSEFEKQRVWGSDRQEADVKNVVFGQLSSFAHVMSLFGVDNFLARKVLEKHCQIYQLPEDETNLLLGLSFADDSPSQPFNPSSRSISLEVVDELNQQDSAFRSNSFIDDQK